jgi:hypothetical protein
VAAGDYDNDGFPDLFIANTGPNALYHNNGNGTFTDVTAGSGLESKPADTLSVQAAWFDYDNDGFVDVFYNDLMGQTWGLFRNQGGKLFRYVSPATRILQLSERLSGWSNGFIDYNNDGWKDIYSANGDVDNLTPGSPQHDTMFENVDGKRFIDVSGEMGHDFLRSGYQRGSAFADLNNDGYLDVVVTSLNEKPRILLNSADTGSHWLLLRLVGHRSNRDAIGARIAVTTPSGRMLYNHVTGSVGFMSTSDLRVHFGLGAENAAAAIEIRWPSGQVQSLKNVKADQILKIEEP